MNGGKDMLLTVNTKYGTVQGVACDAKGVAAYKGIPYAKPPIGDLRWQAPQKPDSWEGVRLCDTFGSPCMQTLRPEGNFYRTEFYTHKFHPYPPKWGEDCLYLNIWTAAENQKAGLPVMVWIHGGGFTQGYGHEPRYDGQTLASNGVILVSINYRLNIFGFFGCKALTEESARSGNYGILDQLAAIEWIKENIEAFGGNPNNITIFGQSAGAISVQTIAASPLAAGKVN